MTRFVNLAKTRINVDAVCCHYVFEVKPNCWQFCIQFAGSALEFDFNTRAKAEKLMNRFEQLVSAVLHPKETVSAAAPACVCTKEAKPTGETDCSN